MSTRKELELRVEELLASEAQLIRRISEVTDSLWNVLCLLDACIDGDDDMLSDDACDTLRAAHRLVHHRPLPEPRDMRG